MNRSHFDHPALFYADTEQYVTRLSAFVRSAVGNGDAVLVAVPEPNLTHLRTAVADVADRVTFADMSQAGRNPGRILPGVLLPFANAHDDRRASIIGEPIWASRSDAEYPACAAHEALINTAFAGRDAAILCPYDTTTLQQWAIDDAVRTHPVVEDADGRRRSPGYTDPVRLAAGFSRRLPPVPADAIVSAYRDRRALGRLRRLVAEHAVAVGLGADRVEDFTMAVNELTTNTVEHTPDGGRLSLWTRDGHLICEVSDGGYLDDPLAGRVPAAPDAYRGRGLVLVNLLCDLVRIHATKTGTTVRVAIRVPR